jgi:hypothetical protein
MLQIVLPRRLDPVLARLRENNRIHFEFLLTPESLCEISLFSVSHRCS